MKILQVIPTLGFGGAERLVLELSKHLLAEGHEVKIVIFINEVAYSELADGLDIYVIPSRVFYSLFGKDVIRCDEFNEFVDDFKPDVIHSHLVEAELVSRQNPRQETIYLTHWHGCNPIADKLKLSELINMNRWRNLKQRRILEKLYLQSNTHFACISEFIEDYLKTAFSNIPSSRFHTIYNGVRLIPRSPDKTKETQPTTIELVSLGRLAKFKKQGLLLDVTAELKNRGYGNIRLNFIGDGESRTELELKTKQLDLDQMVKFHGSIENPMSLLSTYHVMVHSTINEAFGLAVVEGMSCSLPVVAFRAGGVPEIIDDQVSGFLVKPDNTMKFADAVEKLLVNDAQRIQMGENAKKKAAQFTMEAFCQNTENLYFELQNARPL